MDDKLSNATQQGYLQQNLYPPLQAYPATMGEKQPPPYLEQGQGAQQTAPTVIVVSQPPGATQVVQHQPVGDYYYTLSILMTMLCVMCGFWPLLFCTIAALIFSVSARDSAAQGDQKGAQNKGIISLILNIAAVVTYFALITAIVIYAAVISQ
ncbi:PREDICTED: uncharacterized protein LOC109582885 [Amphimedon queenslandica]|uniref:Uncharacterized protein n=1 Tax=Amphimedon queenslandica TaxID=400682 RepID=A0AAN0J8Z5_AMPQE|nr:PREDICTED: uncharacterized protein LOC109582885 [Amphimedon queenslandica]|eukprot:XP_019853489.1 PREDICTED: uncharacterized protein LOC109582885 [Amphimedon queenslandica]